MKKLIIIIGFLVSLTTTVSAINKSYSGKVTQIITLGADGSFLVYIDNNELKANCKHQRVQWNIQDMGVNRTKAAFSLATTALVSDRIFGVVVNIQTPGENCYASPTTSTGAILR